MTEIYRKIFPVTAADVDCFDRLKPGRILTFMQEAAGDHSALLGTDRPALQQRNLFWAVIRHRVQVTRLPRAGETVTVETWPMPTTRSAYPRSTLALDADGNELFRCISLWVLMDTEKRRMILPGKSGVEVEGLVRGSELAVPDSLMPLQTENRVARTVRFSDLDWNGHMNNCRYLDWVADTLPAAFHKQHPLKDFSVCYLNECRENDIVMLHWDMNSEGVLHVDATREKDALSAGGERVFSAKMQF